MTAKLELLSPFMDEPAVFSVNQDAIIPVRNLMLLLNTYE